MDDARPIRTRSEDSAPPPTPWETLVVLQEQLRRAREDALYLRNVLAREQSAKGQPLSVDLFALVAEAQEASITLGQAMKYHGYPTAGGSTADVGVRP